MTEPPSPDGTESGDQGSGPNPDHGSRPAPSGWVEDDDYVFASRDGRHVQWRSLDASFVRAQARAGVRRQRFHDMRHAFATLLLDAGEKIAVISKMLGHADYSTTVDVYSHLSTERSRIAAARIDGLLKRRQAPDEAAV